MVERPNKPAAIPVSPIAPTPQVSLSDDNARVIATLPSGERLEVLLYGAHVISWRSATGKENLFLSEKAHLDGSKAVRGGIPLVFPLFGPPKAESHAETANLPQHGFARTSKWEYLGKSSSESSSLPGDGGDSSVKLDFGLDQSTIGTENASQWPHQFALTYSITLSKDELETSMVVRNTEQKSWDFQILFHTYLKVDDITKVSVTGLETTPFLDKVHGGEAKPAEKPITFEGETDRVYLQSQEQPLGVLENDQKRFEIVRDMLPDVVVWNPWDKKAGSMADFGPADGWKKMVCVEAGSVQQWQKLEGGDAWEGGQRIRLHE